MMRIRVYCPRISSFNVEQYDSSSNVEIPFENFNIDSSSSDGDYYREKGAREKNVLIFWNFWNCVKVKAPLVSHVSAGHESCRRRRCCFKKCVPKEFQRYRFLARPSAGKGQPLFEGWLIEPSYESANISALKWKGLLIGISTCFLHPQEEEPCAKACPNRRWLLSE